MNNDCLERLKQIPNNSIDMAYINSGVVSNEILINKMTAELYRVLKNNTFYACFGSMPTILKWYSSAINTGFQFKIDIVWCQEASNEVKQTHKLIYLFSKGKPKYFKTKDDFIPVSHAHVIYNLKCIKSMLRHLSYYTGITKGKKLAKGGINSKKIQYTIAAFNVKKVGLCGQTFGLNKLFFNSIWAFYPHNNKTSAISRLADLLSKKNDVILDCFAGSETAIISYINKPNNKEKTC